MDKPIRILVANRPKLMRELILATLADEPGIEIVGEVSDDADIPDRVQLTQPDLLVIALDEPTQRPRICDTVLRLHPEVRIIAVAANHNRSIGYWMSVDIHSDDIETSEAGILRAVRSMTAGVGGVS
jgi:DNA-binding NarL/FixJ family response regulator